VLSADRPNVWRIAQSRRLQMSGSGGKAGTAFASRRWDNGCTGQSALAIFASAATVFMLRAVPAFAAGMTSFDLAMPSP
jgi:hypothetical protein